ncbi:MAG: hypothetical protein IPM91_03240 [Bacteroidetes bacterium]|nr:hypothetical protein [Bacteroidota bacterium]
MNNRFHISLLIITLLFGRFTEAQTPCKVCGEYYLEGVRETASGFKINPDSTFEFFFSSGALDRYGSGKWHGQPSLANEFLITFTSGTTQGAALKIMESKKKDDEGISMQIKDANPVVNRYFLSWDLRERTRRMPNAIRKVLPHSRPVYSTALVSTLNFVRTIP